MPMSIPSGLCIYVHLQPEPRGMVLFMLQWYHIWMQSEPDGWHGLLSSQNGWQYHTSVETISSSVSRIASASWALSSFQPELWYWCSPPPLICFEDSVKTVARIAAKFGISYGQPFYSYPDKFRSRWPQVRSPGHKKRYDVRSKFKLSLCTRSTHSFWLISFKRSWCA